MIALGLAELVELVWIAPLAAVVVCISFSACIVGATRSSDARREGRGAQGTAWLVVAVVAGLLTLGEIAAGVGVIVAG